MEGLNNTMSVFNNKYNIIVIVVCCLLGLPTISVLASASTVTVDAPCGQIKGAKEIVDGQSGLEYWSFSNIPYARPPLGELRFSKPQPHPQFERVFDATNQDFVICPNPNGYIPVPIPQTESCLVLNIHMRGDSSSSSASSSNSNSNRLKKVLIYIHGGGFYGGFGGMFNLKSFALSEDIIGININYRLGILGFLSTEDEASPGNYGLWDMALAIKWVKDNIEAFGGDPEDITISGQSSGGSAVDFLSISPHTKGLFTKGYLQSGTAISTYARALHPREDALSFARSVGCLNKDEGDELDVDDSRSMIECLKKKPISDFTKFTDFDTFNVHFNPSVDGDFVPELPSKLLQDELYLDSVGFFDRSYLVGTNNNEAAEELVDLFARKKKIFAADDGKSEEEKEEIYDNSVSDTFRTQIETRFGSAAASDDIVVGKVRDFYGRRFEHPHDLAEMGADLMYLTAPYDFLMATTKRESCKAYQMYFDYFPSYMSGAIKGMPHAGDFPYLFDIPLEIMAMVMHVEIQGEMSEEDLRMRSMFTSVISEFVKTGNPGKALAEFLPSGWPQYNAKDWQYLNFSPKPWISSFLGKDLLDFWLHTIPGLIDYNRGGSCSAGEPDCNTKATISKMANIP